MTSQRVVVATVLCGACTAECRARPGRLGVVQQLGTVEEWFTGLVWAADDPRVAKEWRRRGMAQPGERLPHFVWLVHAGETVEAYCRYHGVGVVPTADVIAARGTVSLNFTATG